jgi:cytochrome b6-f complex iron-sulfur subunit
MSEPPSFQPLSSQSPPDMSKKALHLVSRRRMIQLGWIGGGLAFLGGQFWVLLKLFFRADAPPSLGEDIVVGAAEQFAVGSVIHFWKERFLLVHHPTGFLALSHDCTHSQCQVDFLPEHGVIACPCHGSQFSVTGAVLTGPAIRPLERYTVSHHDGQVVVHTSLRQRTQPSS